MKSKFLSTTEHYDGAQLRSLWNYLEHGILGDSIVAWIGGCRVSREHMVDGEDLLAQERIEGDQMVHFIVEKFECTLFGAVALQRLLASTVMQWLGSWAPNKEIASSLRRSGDDIYFVQKKLSISIATQSPVSSLIHFAVNVVNDGTPVETLSLKDLGVEPQRFAQDIIRVFSDEVNSMVDATHKVKWVR